MGFLFGLVVGGLVGWFAKHYFGAKAQALLDAKVAELEAKIKAKV